MAVMGWFSALNCNVSLDYNIKVIKQTTLKAILTEVLLMY